MPAPITEEAERIEQRNSRLEALAIGRLDHVAIALARQWGEPRAEVLQELLFAALDHHEIQVAEGVPEEHLFLYQTDSYVACYCSWHYRGAVQRRRRVSDWPGHEEDTKSWTRAWVRPHHSSWENRRTLRIAVECVLATLDPTQARWCRLIMQGYHKGEAGRHAGGWTPYRTTMERYAIRDAFIAAGVTP